MRLAPIGVPQVLVVGALDRWGPVGRADDERAVAAGDTLVRLVEAQTSGHFDMIAPTTATWPTVVDAFDALRLQLAPEDTERP